MLNLINSPIESFNWNGRQIWVKRDDLLHPLINGNKARKLAFLLNQQTPQLTAINELISFGGQQSNLMYALAAIAKLKNWQFTYYTAPLSPQAQCSQHGNLAASLRLGMQLKAVASSEFDHLESTLVKQLTPQQLLIRQGGLQLEAQTGIHNLANEIKTWAKQQGLTNLALFVPSGSGTTAYFLQQQLAPWPVYTTNCIGKIEFLQQQFAALQQLSPSHTQPIILPNYDFPFGKVNLKLYRVWQQIQAASTIEFDLVYDPVGWYILEQYHIQIQEPLVYLHCGGTNGNLSMLDRYQYLTKHTRP